MNQEGSTGASGAVMAYVLFYDIVGSSQLTTDSQQVITSQLQKLVTETLQVRQAKERRQLVSIPTGDGAALIFLDNIEDPASCTLSIAHSFKANPLLQLPTWIHSVPASLVESIN